MCCIVYDLGRVVSDVSKENLVYLYFIFIKGVEELVKVVFVGRFCGIK